MASKSVSVASWIASQKNEARSVAEAMFRLTDMRPPSVKTMCLDVFGWIQVIRQNGCNEGVYALSRKTVDEGKGSRLAGAVRVEAYRDGADPVACERVRLGAG